MKKYWNMFTAAVVAVALSGCAATTIGKYDQTHVTFNNVSEAGMDYVESYKRNHGVTGSEIKAACDDDAAGELQDVCLITKSVIRSGPIVRRGSELLEQNELGDGDIDFLKMATEILNENIDLIVDVLAGI